MDTTLTRVHRLDALDAEAFGDMLASASFHLFLDRVRQQLARELAVTERSAEALAIRRAQGGAAALRTVLALPEQILAEMQPGRRGVRKTL